MSEIRTIKDYETIIYPRTLVEAIKDSDNNTLGQLLGSKQSELVTKTQDEFDLANENNELDDNTIYCVIDEN